MEHIFKKVSLKSLNENYFTALNDDWALLTAGNSENFNTMTVSWGTLGILWNKPVIIVFVRPQRYTYEFMNKHHYYTVSFFTPEYKKVLDFCGNHSGRNMNKIKETELTPHFTDLGNVIFEQSRLAFECKKIYVDDINPSKFLDSNIARATYHKEDYHRFFIAEIVNCYTPY